MFDSFARMTNQSIAGKICCNKVYLYILPGANWSFSLQHCAVSSNISGIVGHCIFSQVACSGLGSCPLVNHVDTTPIAMLTLLCSSLHTQVQEQRYTNQCVHQYQTASLYSIDVYMTKDDNSKFKMPKFPAEIM